MSLRDSSHQPTTPPPPPSAPPAGESGRLDFSGTHEEPGVWLPRLQRLLSDQLALTARIDEIDARKTGALADEDMQAYLGLLNERQPVIDRLTELNEDLKPFAERFTLLAASLKQEQRQAIFAQAGRLDAALSQIARRDSAEADELAARRDRIARDLAGMNTGSAALGAYGRREPLPPQSHDQDA